MAQRYSDAAEVSSMSGLFSFVLKGGRGRTEPPPDAPWFDNFGARSSRLRMWRKSSLRGSGLYGYGLRGSKLPTDSTTSAAESVAESSANSSSATGSTFLLRRHWPRSSSSAADGTPHMRRTLVPTVSVFGCFGVGMTDPDAAAGTAQ